MKKRLYAIGNADRILCARWRFGGSECQVWLHLPCDRISQVSSHRGDASRLSVQVINECVSVCLRKLSFSREQAYAFGKAVMERTGVLPLDSATIERAASSPFATGCLIEISAEVCAAIEAFCPEVCS